MARAGTALGVDAALRKVGANGAGLSRDERRPNGFTEIPCKPAT
jgi:hypothetical protein